VSVVAALVFPAAPVAVIRYVTEIFARPLPAVFATLTV